MSDTVMTNSPIIRHIQKCNGSMSVNVPSALAKKLGLTAHSLVKFSTQENKLVLEGVQI